MLQVLLRADARQTGLVQVRFLVPGENQEGDRLLFVIAKKASDEAGDKDAPRLYNVTRDP